jgi:hypothetical protein
MGDFIFGFIIGRVAIGLFRLYFKLLWFLARVAWYLVMFLLLSIGAGVAWLARGGHGEPVDSGRFGRYVDGDTRWEDQDSGNVYPVAATGNGEYCEVYAEEAGTYWRRTAIARLLRRGTIIRYRFFAVTDGTRERAAWCDFMHEARAGIRLDELDPALAGTHELTAVAKDATDSNRDMAVEALKHIEWLLGQRGWAQAGFSDDMGNQHWYAERFSRKAIDWNAPVAAAVTAPAVAAPVPELAAEQPAGEQ